MGNLVEITISGDFQAYERFLKPGFIEKNMKREIRKATIKNALFLVKKIKQRIRKKRYTKNAPLTLALSKGTTPLLDEKNLVDAIGKQIISSFEAVVGFIAKAKTTGGQTGDSRDMKKVVLLLHEGYTIDVTPAMRAAIAIALRERSSRKGNKALKQMDRAFKDSPGAGKDKWRVPGRKFLSSVFRNRAIQAHIRKNWRLAVIAGFRRSGINPQRGT